MQQVWRTIAQFHMLEAGDRVLLGVSGGPDSVALLHLLHSKAVEYGIHLHVVHVHHMLRPEADAEARYVEQLAMQYNIPFRLYKVDVAQYAQIHKMSLEQAGHAVRFQCFHDAKAHWNINKLALGHHRDDRAESVMLHMIQGCGPDGLCAMPPIDMWDASDDSKLIRPFAHVSKEKIVQYCIDEGLHYYIDATNLEPDFLRNRIRLELLPQMKQYNPQIAEALVRLQDVCGAEVDYLTQQVEQVWVQHSVINTASVQFPAEVFRVQHVALQRRLLRRMYQAWNGNTENLSFSQIEQMLSIAMHYDGTQAVDLANGAQFSRRYNTLYMSAKENPKQNIEPVLWDTNMQTICTIWNGTIAIEQDAFYDGQNRDVYTIYADADKLSAQLVIRTRRQGDAIQLSGAGGHKSIKKFLIDKKVPKDIRDLLPMVVSEGRIVWIPGLYKADFIGVTEQTKRICKLCFSPT